MKIHHSRADQALRQAVVAFEQSVIVAPDRSAPALPAFVTLLHAVSDLTRFVLRLALEADRADPIHFEPRILRTA